MSEFGGSREEGDRSSEGKGCEREVGGAEGSRGPCGAGPVGAEPSSVGLAADDSEHASVEQVSGDEVLRRALVDFTRVG